jgi:hypothetical protein
MAFSSTTFTATQVIGEPSQIIITSVVVGTDVAVTKMRAYPTKADATTLVEDGTSTAYEEWSYTTGVATTLDILDKDYCLNIIVQWLNVGNTVLYTETILVMVSLYNEEFYYSLTQNQSANANLLSNRNYYENKMKLRVELDSASQAISYAGDQYGGQACLDRATYLRLNEQLFQ